MLLDIKFYDAEGVGDALLKFAVIVSQYKGEWVFCKHRARSTWEVPGGHREPGESIFDAARRELFEETGAVRFALCPVCAYSVRVEEESFGMLFYADISALGPLPETEIEKIECFQTMPGALTYPLIQPKLMQKVVEVLRI